MQKISHDGFAFVESAVSDDTVRFLDELLVQMVEEGNESVQVIKGQKTLPRKAKDVHLNHPELLDHGRLNNVVNIARNYFGTPNVTLFSSTAWLKPIGGSPKPPHQDGAHWKHVTPTDFLTVWIAVDESSEQNGGVHYLPMQGDKTLLGHVRDGLDFVLQDRVDKERGVVGSLRPGDASVHTGYAIHWSEQNNANASRRGLALAFAHPDIESTDSPGMFTSFLRL